jgi:hypothetical protein
MAYVPQRDIRKRASTGLAFSSQIAVNFRASFVKVNYRVFAMICKGLLRSIYPGVWLGL